MSQIKLKVSLMTVTHEGLETADLILNISIDCSLPNSPETFHIKLFS